MMFTKAQLEELAVAQAECKKHDYYDSVVQKRRVCRFCSHPEPPKTKGGKT